MLLIEQSVIYQKRAFNVLFWKMNLPSLSWYSSHKMGTRKIFNFPVMRIEINVVIRKFLKRIEIGVNNRNFTKWIEISVSIWKFTKWIEISVNIGNFTKWIEVSVNIRIERKGLKLVWPFEIPFKLFINFSAVRKIAPTLF